MSHYLICILNNCADKEQKRLKELGEEVSDAEDDDEDDEEDEDEDGDDEEDKQSVVSQKSGAMLCTTDGCTSGH